MNFETFLVGCVNNTELVKEFERLRRVRLTGPRLTARKRAANFRLFAAFCEDLYDRLPWETQE